MSFRWESPRDYLRGLIGDLRRDLITLSRDSHPCRAQTEPQMPLMLSLVIPSDFVTWDVRRRITLPINPLRNALDHDLVIARLF